MQSNPVIGVGMSSPCHEWIEPENCFLDRGSPSWLFGTLSYSASEPHVRVPGVGAIREQMYCASRRDNQALAGDHDPAAVLTADRIDAAKARHGIAGIDFVDASPPLDQRAAIGDVAQAPAFDSR